MNAMNIEQEKKNKNQQKNENKQNESIAPILIFFATASNIFIFVQISYCLSVLSVGIFHEEVKVRFDKPSSMILACSDTM